MSHRLLSPSKTLMFCAAVLFAASTVQAQTSPSGHVPARTTYPQRPTAPPPFSVHPGDHMFQATMKIAHNYQYAERIAPRTAYYRRPSRPTVPQEAAPVEVAITEPEESTEKVAIRGPNGEVRSFPIVGGRKAIKARTIIVRPGQSINLLIQGGRVVVTGRK